MKSSSFKYCLGSLLLLLVSITGQTQLAIETNFEKRKQVALSVLEKHVAEDTARVNALIGVVRSAVFLTEKKEVMHYLEEAKALSKKLNYRAGQAACYLQQGNYFKSASEYDKALKYFDSTLLFAAGIQSIDARLAAEFALEQKAMIYYSQENYYTALDYFTEAVKQVPPELEQKKIRLYIFITELYLILNNIEQSVAYANSNLALIEKYPDVINFATVYFGLIDICIEQKDFEKAQGYLNRIAAIIPHKEETQINFGYYLKKGRIAFLQQQYELAYDYFKTCYRYAQEGNHSNSKSTALNYLAKTTLQLGKQEDALKYAQAHLLVAEKKSGESRPDRRIYQYGRLS